MDTAELSPGALLGGHLEILSELEPRGAVKRMLARHVTERRDVVVHVMDIGRGAGAAAQRERAAQELENAARLDHACLPGLRACGELGDGVYLVEGAPRGETLKARLEISPRGLSEERVLQHARDVLSLLEAAHEKGAYHGDLRSEALVLVPHAERGEAIRVLELGLVQATEAVRRINPLKWGGRGRRSAFQPPEEGNGRKPPSPSTDLYGVGALMFVMLTGKPASKISTRALQSDVPGAFRGLLQKALGRDPMQRYRSAGDFLEGLSGVVPGAAAAAPSVENTASRFAAQGGSSELLGGRFGDELAMLEAIERDFVTGEVDDGLNLDFVDDSLSAITGGDRSARHSRLTALEMEMAELESERQFEQEATQVYRRDGATVVTAREAESHTAVTRRPMVERGQHVEPERKESTLIARRPLADPEAPDQDLTDLEGVTALRVEASDAPAVESTSLARNPFLPDGEEEEATASEPSPEPSSEPEPAAEPEPEAKAAAEVSPEPTSAPPTPSTRVEEASAPSTAQLPGWWAWLAIAVVVGLFVMIWVIAT